MTFLLYDPGWYVQNKWDDNIHTHSLPIMLHTLQVELNDTVVAGFVVISWDDLFNEVLTNNAINGIYTLREVYIFCFFVCISSTAAGPQPAAIRLLVSPTATLPSPSCLWPLRIFPSLPGFHL